MGVKIEVRPGEGGVDAEVFAGELVGVVEALLRRSSRRCRVDASARTTVVTVEGDVPEVVRRLAGTHRVQRIPASDSRGRRHTSTATIAVLETDGPVGWAVDEAEVEVTWFSGSGAGGQHRNRSANCARVRHVPTGVEVVGTANRSRRQNLAEAKAELARRLGNAAVAEGAAAVNAVRRSQTAQVRSAKTWTWNAQRDEVVEHATGRSWRMRDALRGKLR